MLEYEIILVRIWALQSVLTLLKRPKRVYVSYQVTNQSHFPVSKGHKQKFDLFLRSESILTAAFDLANSEGESFWPKEFARCVLVGYF